MFNRRRIRELESKVAELTRSVDKLRFEFDMANNIHVPDRSSKLWDEMRVKNLPIKDAVLLLANHAGVLFDFTPDRVDLKPDKKAKP